MKTVYVITMWSGGRPAKKWKSEEEPKILAEGTGVSFVSTETRLEVRVIGSISIEQYESGHEDFEMRLKNEALSIANEDRDAPPEGPNIRRLF